MLTATSSEATSTVPFDREMAVLEGERRILELIATGVAWQQVLEAICGLFEAQNADVRASILLVRDGATVHPGAAPSLPPEYGALLDGAPVGLNEGSCGTAAFTKKTVVVEDIATDPIWAAYASLADRFGLRACFSTPILAHDGDVLGTFGIYFLVPQRPSQEQLSLASRAANLASIALERRRNELRLASFHDELEQRIVQRTEALERAVHELERARQAAESANAAKSAFLANMSHEIRTPMSAILGFAQVLATSRDISPLHAESIAAIQSSGEHLLTVIDDVLEMSKIEAGLLRATRQAFDLGTLLLDIERMFRLQAQHKGLTFSVCAASDVPRSIATDQAKLRQILINLVGNAIKFTQQGSVAVAVSHTSVSPGQACVRFDVHDTGIGIHELAQGALFQPFVQADQPAQAVGGTGLGLAISKRLVELLGGRIALESRPGHGSHFWIELEVSVPSDSQTPAQPNEDARPRATATSAVQLLVVDDHAPTRRSLVELLKPLCLSILEANNGEEALAQFERHRPQLVLMDTRMPTMDGSEATRRIRRIAGSDEVRIVAITAGMFEDDAPELRSCGADDVLRKPFRQDTLFDVIEAQLARLPQQPARTRM